MHHHSTGSSVVELIVGLALIALAFGTWFYVVRWVGRQLGGSTRWMVYERRLAFPALFLVIGIILTAKGISGL
jgi:hypothetical protein